VSIWSEWLEFPCFIAALEVYVNKYGSDKVYQTSNRDTLLKALDLIVIIIVLGQNSDEKSEYQ